MSVEVRNLSFHYGQRQILDQINFKAEKGQLYSVIGPNGVGKSTLFQCVLGLKDTYKGAILLAGQDLKAMTINDIAKQIAFIPQSHYPSFDFTVMEMVLMGTTVQVSPFSRPGKNQIKLVDQALERIGIAHLSGRSYTRISGGERQLVLLARALVQATDVLLLDEPTANLDYGNQVRVMTQIKSLTQEGYTVIQSTHHPDQTFLFSDQVLAMKEGRIIASGDPERVLTEELIHTLYATEVNIQSLYDNKVRVCIPRCAI